MNAIYKETIHLDNDKNSFIKPLDKPNTDEKTVKDRKIKSAIGIYLKGLITKINFGKRVRTANIAISIARPVNKPK